MSHYFQNVYLASDSLDIALVLDFILLQDFDGHFLTSENVCAQPNLSESALPQRPTFDFVNRHMYLPTM